MVGLAFGLSHTLLLQAETLTPSGTLTGSWPLLAARAVTQRDSLQALDGVYPTRLRLRHVLSTGKIFFMRCFWVQPLVLIGARKYPIPPDLNQLILFPWGLNYGMEAWVYKKKYAYLFFSLGV